MVSSLKEPQKRTTEIPLGNSPATAAAKNALPIWKARPEVPKEKELIDLVNETCKRLKIKKSPRLCIYDDSHRQLSGGAGFINAYLFSQSALDILSHDQLKAVVAHEMTHRKHMAREFTIVGGTTGLAVTAAVITSFVFSPLIAIPALLGLFIATVSGEFWYRRRIEREADLGGAKIAGPQAMIDALRVVEKQKDEIQGETTKQVAKHIPPFLRLYPTIDERIQHIQKHYPQKDVPSEQTEEASQPTCDVAQYTVSAVQGGSLSEHIKDACGPDHAMAECPSRIR